MKNLIYVSVLTLLCSGKSFAQQLENLGEKINTTAYQECFPTISPDGKTLFFSRKNAPGGKGESDIYYSELDTAGNWTEGKPMDGFNNSVKNVIYHISPDGNQIVLLGKYGAAPTEKGLSWSNKTATGWTDPVAIPFEQEESISWGNNACTFSPNGNVMILSLKGDLHVSFKKGDVWSFPQVFQGGITTSDNEYSPFLSSDNKTLYFSGGGHGGLGMNDIFKTTRLDDTWLNWSAPENLGEPINNKEWQSFFKLAAKGDYAYVYTLVNEGDLFRVKLKEELKPQPVVLVKGKVLDSKTKMPIPAASVSYEILANGSPVGTASSNPQTGEYMIVLGYGQNYGFSAGSKGYISVSENLDLTKVEEYREITKDLYLTPIEVGSIVRMNNIFFDVAKATLKPESAAELNKVAAVLKDNPGISIEIGGHTDSDGSDDLNKKLSQSRANSVKAYLESLGISAARVTSVGYGEAKPSVPNNSDDNKQLNRRVEFKITKK
ncbi:MAG: OmpA family protein [Crocinitomicaceae bacterium]|jgi:outer membrane protein OmpA-like peptidoglycan-associated protein|nr:OmpA family protein [Crocinitomicaceae bacterium]